MKIEEKPEVPNLNNSFHEYAEIDSNKNDFLFHIDNKLKFGEDFTDFFRIKSETESDLEQIFHDV
jgi:hypothetical protein